MQSLTVVLSLVALVGAQQGGFGGGFGGRGGMGGGFGGGVGGGMGGGRGGQGGRGGYGGPVPPFLVNVTQDGRTAFFQLFKDQNQTKAQIKTAVDAWATTYGATAAVSDFETEWKAKQAERRANVTTAVGQLANAISQLTAIEDNQSLTMSETQEQIHAAIDAMSPELRDLVVAAGPAGPHGGRGGKGGKFGGPGGFNGNQGGRGGFNGGRTQGRF